MGMGAIVLGMGGHGCDIIGHGFHSIMGAHPKPMGVGADGAYGRGR